jgi:hypothetical protein
MNRLKTAPGGIPLVDESDDRLHRTGWSIGERVTSKGRMLTSLNGGNLIEAIGHIQSEVRQIACEQARAVGMLAGVRS